MSELWDINWELLESLHCEKIKIHLKFEIQNLQFWEGNSEKKIQKFLFSVSVMMFMKLKLWDRNKENNWNFLSHNSNFPLTVPRSRQKI